MSTFCESYPTRVRFVRDPPRERSCEGRRDGGQYESYFDFKDGVGVEEGEQRRDRSETKTTLCVVRIQTGSRDATARDWTFRGRRLEGHRRGSPQSPRELVVDRVVG